MAVIPCAKRIVGRVLLIAEFPFIPGNPPFAGYIRFVEETGSDTDRKFSPAEFVWDRFVSVLILTCKQEPK